MINARNNAIAVNKIRQRSIRHLKIDITMYILFENKAVIDIVQSVKVPVIWLLSHIFA